VRPEHVIEAAGRLVGHGIGAAQLAQIMSDMPSTGGEGLAGWIRMHDATISQAEAQLIQENRVIGHRLGVAAVTSMAATHMESRVQQNTPPRNINNSNADGTNQLVSEAPPRGRPPII